MSEETKPPKDPELDAAVLRVPYWLLLAATGALPIAGLLRAHQRRRAAREAALRGHCPVCGYDLRAHTRGERCPECGTAVKG